MAGTTVPRFAPHLSNSRSVQTFHQAQHFFCFLQAANSSAILIAFGLIPSSQFVTTISTINMSDSQTKKSILIRRGDRYLEQIESNLNAGSGPSTVSDASTPRLLMPLPPVDPNNIGEGFTLPQMMTRPPGTRAFEHFHYEAEGEGMQVDLRPYFDLIASHPAPSFVFPSPSPTPLLSNLTTPALSPVMPQSPQIAPSQQAVSQSAPTQSFPSHLPPLPTIPPSFWERMCRWWNPMRGESHEMTDVTATASDETPGLPDGGGPGERRRREEVDGGGENEARRWKWKWWTWWQRR